MSYFKYFPTVSYPFTDDARITITVTNILKRMALRKKTENFLFFYETFLLSEHDTPELVSTKVYGSPNFHWVILLANKIANPRYDWMLDNFTFTNWVEKKYRGDRMIMEDGFNLCYETNDKIITEDTHSSRHNADAVHHYEDSEGYQVMSTATGATAISNRIYEEAINETRREINILQPKYLSLFVEEFKGSIQR